MDTTTNDGGAGEAQPQESAAVAAETSTDQVVTTDEHGTPTLADAPSESASAAEEPAEAPEAQATDDTVEWAKKKGLELNPENPNEVRLAQMQREAEKKMHEATQRHVPPPELLQQTGDPNYDPIVERQNTLELRQYVRDWFDANPDMKDHRAELQKIAIERPWLADMDDVRAHFLANPSREAQLKMDGGREALTNLAQKQSQIPPGANATNSSNYVSQEITPGNVYDLVEQNDQEWFEKNKKAIDRAISGK